MAKNPIEEYQETKEAARSARKQNEIDLWHRWKTQGQQPEHLQPLLKLYEPNLRFKVKQWKAPNVSEAAFRLELQDHLINSFKTFDPNKGAALNTWVEGRLKKAQRYNIRNQNLAYIPEGQVSKISPIDRARDHLTEELGRMPTAQEISEHINDPSLTPKRVDTVLRSQRKDIPGSALGGEGGSEGRQSSYEEQQLEVAKNMLHVLFPNKPEIHTVFNYTFGMNDHPQILSTGELARKMGKSEPQIARMKTQMGNTLKQYMGLSKKQED